MGGMGRVVLELPPREGNPRNSEGAFLRLSDGRLLFAYSKFVGNGNGDDAPACIAFRHSRDGGKNWDGDDEVAFQRERFQAKNIMSVSLLRMADGDLGLFFCLRKGWHDTRTRLFRSPDEGRSFRDPVCCIPAPGYFVVNNDRVVRLSSGRLVLPTSYHRMKAESTEDWKSFDGRAIGVFFLSDDDGGTWREAKQFCTLPHPASATGLQESGVLELRTGVLWAFFRTDMGCHYESFSFDGGESWTQPAPSRFTGPCSPLCAKRMPDGRILAVWNPIPQYPTRERKAWSWGRTPLACAVSADDGAGWSAPRLVEDGADNGGYCYTAIHFEPDAALLAYCAGGEADRICLARLRMRRIPYAEF
jgi:sialidase-1